MQVVTTVTQKGQVTIPKKIRDKVGIKAYDRVTVEEKRGKVSIRKEKTLLDIVPLAKAPKGKNALKAREEMHKNYTKYDKKLRERI